MARIQLRNQVIELRKQGKTYREIRLELGVSKSTLSDWLRNLPLSSEELALLKTSKEKSRFLAIEKIRNTKQNKRNERLRQTYDQQKKDFLPLTTRELLIAGMFLYWGEGQKRMPGYIGLTNTNPKVVKFSLYWMTRVLKIPKEKIHVYLHLYSDMNINEKINFWSNELKINKTQFIRPYIKANTRDSLTQKGFGQGTCSLVVNNILIKEKFMMGIDAIADYYCSKL